MRKLIAGLSIAALAALGVAKPASASEATLVATVDCSGVVTVTVAIDSAVYTGSVIDWWADGAGKGLQVGPAPITDSFTAANGAQLHIGVNVVLNNGAGSSPTADVIVPAPCVATTVAPTTVATTTATTVVQTTVATTVAPSTTATVPGSTISPTTTDDSPTEETVGTPITLPRTGAGSGSTPLWATLLVGLGILLVWAGRRKRSPIAS